MWAGRFRAAPDATFDAWQRSLPFDWQLLDAELRASRAHALALEAARILTAEERARIVDALEAIGESYAGRGVEVARDAQAEDIHHFVELRLKEAVGDLGLKLHTGRSRNEQIATDLRLFVRAQINELVAKIAAWAGALVEQAKQCGRCGDAELYASAAGGAGAGGALAAGVRGDAATGCIAAGGLPGRG